MQHLEPLKALPNPTATVFVIRHLEETRFDGTPHHAVDRTQPDGVSALVCFSNITGAFLYREETTHKGTSLVEFTETVQVRLPEIMGGYERYLLDGEYYQRPEGRVYCGVFLPIVGTLNIDTCRFINGGLPNFPELPGATDAPPDWLA